MAIQHRAVCAALAFLFSAFPGGVGVFADASATRTIHVFVALCDNEHQGIVPVPPFLGDGDNPRENLYWGASMGMKTYLKASGEWQLLSSTENSPEAVVLERCVFKHRSANVYLVADAYRGREIRRAVADFLKAAAGQDGEEAALGEGSRRISLRIGGSADLLAYVGHNGLMDFQLDRHPKGSGDAERDAIVLACKSKAYFSKALAEGGAHPLLWTTGLMAPEAYALKAAIDGWILGESGEKIRLRSAQAYHRFQKCGLKAAQNLFATGW
jgi:hypothetical protein